MRNSYWLDSVCLPKFPNLEKNLKVDVCIIGGGITGLSTAYYLTKNGYEVCVLEKDRLCHHTTRKYNCENYITT